MLTGKIGTHQGDVCKQISDITTASLSGRLNAYSLSHMLWTREVGAWLTTMPGGGVVSSRVGRLKLPSVFSPSVPR
jgi:hypothetical protein